MIFSYIHFLFLTKTQIILIFTFFLINSCSIFRSIELAKNKPNPFNAESISNDVQVYWIGHATTIFRIYDKWFITDPNFNESLGWMVKRYIEPGMQLTSIQPVDFILISHTHLDHLDRDSLRMLKYSKNILVPSGGKNYIPDKLFFHIVPVDNWKVYETDGVKITAVPVQHFGGRLLLDNIWDGEPYTGYIIEYKGVTVFFGGDTGYNKSIFKNIGNKFKIDVALIPVGPIGLFSKDGIGNSIHVNPKGAIEIFKDVKASIMIPVHHSTFYRSSKEEYPVIKSAIDDSGLTEKIYLLDIGERLNINKVENRLIVERK